MKRQSINKRPAAGACIIALLLLFCLHKGFAQTDSLARARLDEVLKMLQELKDEDEQTIGYVRIIDMKNARFPVYSNAGICIKTAKVDSAIFILKDGFIVDIKLFSQKTIYSNDKAPVALSYSRFRNNKSDKIRSRDGSYFILQEVFFLSLDNNFIPNDDKVVLNDQTDFYKLKKNVGINTILDVRLYSDALGLLGSQPNAIAQTDLRLKQFVHRKNMPEHGKFLGQYFKAYINVSKFDSKDKYIDSLDYSRSRLLQKSYANAEVSFNAINGWLAEKKSSNLYYADAGGGLFLGRLSKHGDSITSDISLPYWFMEAGMNLRSADNIGADFYVRYTKSYLAPNSFTYDGVQMEFFNIGTELFFNPLKNRANRFFARINYTVSTTKKERNESFLKAQLGYSVLLTKLLEKK